MFSAIREEQILVLILWFAAVLVLWNLRRHITFLTTKKMVATFAAISFLAMFYGWGQELWQQHDKTPLQNRIAIYAMPTSENGQLPRLQPQGIALAELVISALQAKQKSDLHAYPLEWLYRAPHPDSIAFATYLKQFATAAGYPYFVIGRLRGDRAAMQLEAQLFQAGVPEPIWHTNLPVRSDRLIDAARELANGIANALGRAAPNLPALADRPAEYYDLRLALLQQNRFKADELARKQLAADSSDALALLRFAELELDDPALQEKSQKTREQELHRLSLLLANASDMDSSHVRLAYLTGKAFYWREKFNEAAQYTLRALRHSPYGDSDVYSLLAKLHFSRYRPLGFLNEVEVYQYALRCDPANLEAVIDLAGVHIILKQTGQAQKLLERYQRLFPENVRLLRALGEIYVLRGLTEKIFATYEQILQQNPADADAYYNLGIYYFNSTDTLNAKRFFNKAIAVGGHKDSHLYLAKIAEKQNKYEEAIAHLRERIRLRNSSDDAYAEEARRHLFELMLALGKIDSTGKVLE